MTTNLPATDEQIENMLAAGRHVPLAAVSFPNWHNAYTTLVDDLKAAYREEGIDGLRNATMAAADDVVRNALDDAGLDREPTPDEVLATAVRVVAVPGTTRNAFVRGAVAELLWEDTLESRGFEILTTAEVEAETGVSAYNQERSKGWDVTARNPETDELTHFQVKATASEPSLKKRKDADALIWFEVDDDGAMLSPEPVEA